MMTRRHILAALGAAAVAAPASGSDRPVWGDRTPPELPLSGRIRLLLPDGSWMTPKRIILLGPDGPMALTPPGNVELRDEDRLNLRWLPLVGQWQQQTANAEFAGAFRVGTVWVWGESLVIGVARGDPPHLMLDGVRRMVVANRDRSFRFAIDPKRDATPFAGGIPALDGLPRVGKVLRTPAAMLVIVRPSLVDPEG